MNAPRPLHVEIQKHRRHVYGLIRSSYRENGRVKHTTHGRLTGMSLPQLKLVQAAFRGDVIPKNSPDAFRTRDSKEYGASAATLALARELGLDRAIYSRREPWVDDLLAMIVGRLVFAGSKLAARHLKDGCLVLYDITSSYFEGAYDTSDLVLFGYNRDGKRGHEQIVVALCAMRTVVQLVSKCFPATHRMPAPCRKRSPTSGRPTA